MDQRAAPTCRRRFLRAVLNGGHTLGASLQPIVHLRVDRDRAVAAARRSAGVLARDGTEPEGPVPLGGYVLAARHAGRCAELDAAE